MHPLIENVSMFRTESLLVMLFRAGQFSRVSYLGYRKVHLAISKKINMEITHLDLEMTPQSKCGLIVNIRKIESSIGLGKKGFDFTV